jgi:hypothetical protein
MEIGQSKEEQDLLEQDLKLQNREDLICFTKINNT